MATWTGSPRSPERRMDPRVLWPGVRSVIMLGVNYGPDENPLAILQQRTRGAISVYAQGDDYHDVIKKRLKALARWLVAQSGAEVESVRRYRGRDGKAAGAGRGTGLAGQAHQSCFARIRLLAVSRRDLYGGGSAARRAPRPIIAAHARPASTSARPRRFPRPTSSMRAAAFPTSRSRTRDRFRTNFARPSATASMAATIASPPARGTSSRKQGREAKARRARRIARARARRTGPARRCGVSRAVCEIAGQAHRPRPIYPQRADRDRQRR